MLHNTTEFCLKPQFYDNSVSEETVHWLKMSEQQLGIDNLRRSVNLLVPRTEFAENRVNFVSPETMGTSFLEVGKCFSTNSDCPMAVPEAATMKEEDEDVGLVQKMELTSGRECLKKRKAEFTVEEEFKEKMVKGEVKVVSIVKEKNSTETSADTSSKEKKTSDIQKTDYIHVRARRGQATDSHSLAERARREKISKKMKFLQGLVPGCNKITGKAGMLDEIINYVQSLQRQVEHLSMKLAALNPDSDSNGKFSPNQFQALVAGSQAANMSLAMANLPNLQLNTEQATSTFCELERLLAPQIASQRTTNPAVSVPQLCLDPAGFSQDQGFPTWDASVQHLLNLGFH